ncbi:hypothetical protein [Bacillus sp. AK128]
MGNEQTNKRFKLFVVLTLLVSIIININLLSKVGQLENEVYLLSQNQHNILSNVSNQSNQVQRTLDEFINEQSWISSFKMDINHVEANQSELAIQWQVKELQSESEVLFNYVYGEKEENYKVLPAEEIQQGLFQVKIPVEFDIEPQWEVGMISNSDMDNQSKMEEEAKKVEEYNKHTLKYFVSVSNQDMVKSSEILTEHIGYFGASLYGLIHADLHLGNNHADITLINDNIDSSIFLEEVYLLKYEGDQLIQEEELELDDQSHPPHVRFFQITQVEQVDDMRLVLKVLYSNGETFEKEVY